MASKWSDSDSEWLTELHAAGKSLHSISKDMGRSKDTVSRYAKELGLSFNRSATAKAAEAVHVDNKAKRATLESRLLDEAAKMLDQMWQPAIVYSFGGSENTYEEHELERPDFAAQKAIVQTASTAIQASSRLHDMNSDRKDLPSVDAWLAAMLGGD